MNDTRLLTVSEAAIRLGLTAQRVYRRITRGDLPAQRMMLRPPQYRIREEDLDQYIAAGGGLTPPRENPLWVSTGEAARMTGISQAEIRRMCQAGDLRHRVDGKRSHYRIDREHILSLIR